MATPDTQEQAQAKAAPAAKRPPVGEVASLVRTDRYASFLNDTTLLMFGPKDGIYLNPDPIVVKEDPANAEGVYDIMVNKDTHLGGVWDQRLNALLSLPRAVEPASDSPEHVDHARYCEAVLNAIPEFNDARRRLMFSVMRGFAIGEVLWTSGPKGVGIAAIRDRDPRRIVFDLDWKPRLRTQGSYQQGEVLPERKFLVSRWNAREGNPYGQGIGQAIYWPWLFKKSGVKFWMVFAEKFGMPTVVATLPKGSGRPEHDKVLKVIDSIQTATGITIDEGVALDLLEAARTGSAEVYEKLATFFNEEMSKRTVGQTMTTQNKGSGGLGNGGVANAHSLVRADILEQDACEQDETLSELCAWITYFQYGYDGPYPKHKTDAKAPEDTAAMAATDKVVINEMGLEVPEAWLRERYGYPEPKAGEKTIGAPPPAPIIAGSPAALKAKATGKPAPKPGGKFSEVASVEEEAAALDAVGEGALVAAFLTLQRQMFASLDDPGKA